MFWTVSRPIITAHTVMGICHTGYADCMLCVQR